MRVAVMLAAAAAVTAVSACGTTLPVATQGQLSGAVARGGTTATAQATSGTPVASSAGAAARGSTQGTGAGSSRAGAAATAAGPVRTLATQATSGGVRGVSAKTANLGITYFTGADAAFASFGVSISTGDGRSFAEQLIKIINDRGGVLGRKIVPVWHEVKVADETTDQKTSDQQTCAAFNQDNKVFATVAAPIDCMVAAKTPDASIGQNALDQQYFTARAPYYYGPSLLNTDSLTPTLLDRLQAKAFLTKTSRIGIWYPDTDVQRRVLTKLKQALAARGLNVVSDFGYDPSSASSFGSAPGDAVLRFRAANVDRVLTFDANISFFMITAERQGYRPKYALSTYLNLASVQESVPPQQQLVGSIGVGWQPRNDVDQAQQLPLAGTKDCALAAKNSGQPNPTGTAAFTLYGYCDAIQTLLFGAQHGGGFSPTDIRRGLTLAGASFPSALNFTPAYGLGRYDGAQGVRDIAYDNNCSCFRYEGQTVHPTR